MKTAEQLILTAKSRIQQVSVHDLFDAMKNHKTILIDVREPEEFQASAIDHTVNYPRGVLEMRIHQHPLASHHCDTVQALEHLKDQPIYLICGTGGHGIGYRYFAEYGVYSGEICSRRVSSMGRAGLSSREIAS